MSFTAPESLTEKIAQHLSMQIIEGELSAGERIQETRIVNDLQVSRGPVREALLLLEARYLVTILPRRGAFVSHLTRDNVEGLYEIYGHLLNLLVTRVSHKWTDETIQPLLDQVAVIKNLSNPTPRRFIDEGFALMNMAYRVSGNIYLCDTLTKLQPALYRTYAIAMRENAWQPQRGITFFTGLLSNVLARKPEQLPQLIGDYASYQCQLVLTALHKHKENTETKKTVPA